MISLDSIAWKMKEAWSFGNSGAIKFRDDELGLQWEQHTNKDKYGVKYLKPRNYFFIDDDPREFTCIDDLIKAYNDKFQFEGENPNHEVVFVKVIKKRNNSQTT